MGKKHKKFEIDCGEFFAQVTQKKMKMLRIRIDRQSAEVKVSAPFYVSQKKLREFVLERILWIKEHRQKILLSLKNSKKNFVDGEEHLLFGEKFVLRLLEAKKISAAFLQQQEIYLPSPATTPTAARLRAIDEFYKKQLKNLILEKIPPLEKAMNVKVAGIKIRKMKSRWGSCIPRLGRICINLELAKFPPQVLQMILVHEMVHMLEKRHNQRFYSLMDRFMPDWKMWNEQLSKNRMTL